MNFAHDGGMCQNSLLLQYKRSTADQSHQSFSWRITLWIGKHMYSVSLYGRSERSIKDAISSDEQNHITTYGQTLLHCSYSCT